MQNGNQRMVVRFHLKSNYNMIVEVKENEELKISRFIHLGYIISNQTTDED